MTDYPVLGIKETIEVMESGQVRALSDIHNVEAALELIRKTEEKIDEYKEIKKKRAALIDNEIENFENRIAFLKSVISETLKSSNQKAVAFPGLGKVNRSVKKGNWIIKDEDKLIEVLKAEGEYTTCVETKEVIKKGEVNKLMEVWDKIQKVPEDAIEKSKDEDSVRITFEKATLDPSKDVVSVAKPVAALSV